MSRTVLISGASSGIGAATALAASASGWRVLLGYHTGRQRAESVVAKIRSGGGDAFVIPLSLDGEATITMTMDAVSKCSPTLDAIILSASPKPNLASFLKTTKTEMRTQLECNVLNTHSLMAEVWKRFFRVKQSGHIVGVLSLAAADPVWPHMTSYIVAKRGLEALIECALAEFAKEGLRASLLYPDYTETPMLTTIDSRILETARVQRPNGFLSAMDVAASIVHCLNHPPKGVQPSRQPLRKGSK